MKTQFLYLAITGQIIYTPSLLTKAGHFPPAPAQLQGIAEKENCELATHESGYTFTVPVSYQLFEARATTHRIGLEILSLMKLDYQSLQTCMTTYDTRNIREIRHAKI